MAALCEYFAPDPDALLRAIAPLMDDAMLRQIAEADYGMAVEAHLAPLRKLRDAGEIPKLDWHPREVLELIRWSEPDQPSWKPGGQGARGHWMRAFACAALLRAYPVGDNAGHCYAINETVIQLTRSLIALDAAADEAASFFAWCMGAYAEIGEADEQAFLGLPLLRFVLPQTRVSDETIVALCQWIDGEAQRAMSVAAARGAGGQWLLSTTVHNLRASAWIELGRDLLAADAAGRSADARCWVRLIGAALAGAGEAA